MDGMLELNLHGNYKINCKCLEKIGTGGGPDSQYNEPYFGYFKCRIIF